VDIVVSVEGPAGTPFPPAQVLFGDPASAAADDPTFKAGKDL
jgi:hypothetical protein